ncbi:MAG: hypothetical protein J2P57_24580 [Acidimicrobiaceae bacterium]|nr:hypothetical protein [Acidimicrobiaceae bacterium]
MPELEGTPSDDVPEILSLGGSDVSTVFVSMSSRDPEGRDAEYLQWHTLDHRPEQYRLPGLRGSLRLVSTPACRAARAVSDERYDAVDHVMTYFFADGSALGPFARLGADLRKAGRMPHMLPAVERGVYHLRGTGAAPRVKVGADVLPWWPATGVYLLVERGGAGASDLVEVPGVGGVWWADGHAAADQPVTDDVTGLQVTFCFLDDDPVNTASRLRPSLEKRWANDALVPLLAAPFHIPVNYDWTRYVP